MQVDDYLRLFQTSPDDTVNKQPTGNPAANAYNCVPYLFSASAVGLTRTLKLPAIGWFYSGRPCKFCGVLDLRLCCCALRGWRFFAWH